MMTIKQSGIKATKSLARSIPMLLGTILLISLISSLVPKSFYSNVFSQNIFIDSIIGSSIGSISMGNPVTSYILGGEFLKEGISLIAVSSFILAWVTVGIIQLPAEIPTLGKNFAIARNFSAFIFAILISIATVSILNILN